MGCFESPPAKPGGLTSHIYGGAEPQGDYVALTIDAANSTITYDNYTTTEHYGPLSFHKVIDPAVNKGFTNLYETDAINGDGDFARFIICNGVAIAYVIFNSGGTMIGTPAYAFCRKSVPLPDNIDVYKNTAYNWVKFKIGASEGDFEAGFAAMDSDTDGTFYGAGYDNQSEIGGDPNHGVHNINEGGNLKLSNFTYDSGIVANYYAANTLTLIGTTTHDFILDFGSLKGAGLAIQQAAQADYQSSYSGTYFLLTYENDNSPTHGQVFKPLKLVVSAATTQGQGHYQVYDFDTGTQIVEDDVEALETYPSGPNSSPIAPQFKDISTCYSNATSDIVKNAYQCHGAFIGDTNSGSNILCAMFDPAGKYLCFTIFNNQGNGNYNYTFGFGIKDNGM